MRRRRGRGRTSSGFPTLGQPAASNVVYYMLDLDGAHLALLRDFPVGCLCPKNNRVSADLQQYWVCVGLSAVGNRIRCVS